jgi:hypothetical protein
MPHIFQRYDQIHRAIHSPMIIFDYGYKLYVNESVVRREYALKPSSSGAFLAMNVSATSRICPLFTITPLFSTASSLMGRSRSMLIARSSKRCFECINKHRVCLQASSLRVGSLFRFLSLAWPGWVPVEVAVEMGSVGEETKKKTSNLVMIWHTNQIVINILKKWVE